MLSVRWKIAACVSRRPLETERRRYLFVCLFVCLFVRRLGRWDESFICQLSRYLRAGGEFIWKLISIRTFPPRRDCFKRNITARIIVISRYGLASFFSISLAAKVFKNSPVNQRKRDRDSTRFPFLLSFSTRLNCWKITANCCEYLFLICRIFSSLSLSMSIQQLMQSHVKTITRACSLSSFHTEQLQGEVYLVFTISLFRRRTEEKQSVQNDKNLFKKSNRRWPGGLLRKKRERKSLKKVMSTRFLVPCSSLKREELLGQKWDRRAVRNPKSK